MLSALNSLAVTISGVLQTHNEQRKLKEEETTALEEENYSFAEELKEQIEEKNLLLTGSRPLVEELVEVGHQH